MSSHNENNLNNMYEELNRVSLALYESSIDLWRNQEKCNRKYLNYKKYLLKLSLKFAIYNYRSSLNDLICSAIDYVIK